MTSQRPCLPSQPSPPQPRASWSRSVLERHVAALHDARRFLVAVHHVDGERDTGQVAYAAMTHLLPVLDDVDRLLGLVSGARGRDPRAAGDNRNEL